MSAFRKLLFMVPAKLLGKRIILHFHSFSPETTTAGRFKSIYSWMFRHADQIVVLSDYWHEQVKKISGQTPLEVIYNPARLPSSGSRERLPFILFAGTLGKRKGYADLIRAFAVVSSRHPDWCLVLAGNGETAEAEALSRELNISERVKVMGWVSGSKKEDLFYTASVFCLPSYAEGFPMSVIEAMAYRIPVVSTPVGGIRDVFLEHEDMLLVAPGCVYELAAKLDMMIRYPVMRQKMADASFVKIREHFALDQVGDKLDRLYHRLGKKD
jgi:glycosyltransferase involved in cell wall biosynthesis